MTDAAESTGTPWWVRVRSAVALTLLLALIGVVTAGLFGLVALALGTLMDRALG